jgi:hypothetical protein
MIILHTLYGTGSRYIHIQGITRGDHSGVTVRRVKYRVSRISEVRSEKKGELDTVNRH